MPSLSHKKSRLLPVAGVFVLAASAVVVLFSGTAGINEGNIEEHLQHFSQYVSSQADAAGKKATFSYSAPEFSGWGFNKHATVDNVTLDIADKATPGISEWAFSTASMLVMPDAVNADGLVFEFPGPINVSQSGQPKTMVSFPAPLQYVYSETGNNQKRSVTQMVRLPNQITLAGLGADKGQVVITYNQHPLFRHTFTSDNQVDALYSFYNVKITTADGTQFTSDLVDSHFNQLTNKDNRREGKYALKLSNFVIHTQGKASKAYNVNINLLSHSDLPAAAADANAIGNSETVINDMQLGTDAFKIKISGNVSTASDDSLPFGNATVDIDNVPQFLASELLPDVARKALADGLQKVTGQPLEKLTNATIPLKRDKGNVLYIGDISFQTLAASVLTDMIQAAPAAAFMPATPAPAAVAPAPDNATAPAVPAAPGTGATQSEPAKSSM